ncbi:class I SAM-dependent methyltransferase [Fibrivirga algicola]|uniref:Class I SAM-dependent methyltransferase n=1 Tax=Fibrivirga algicola TaxID=2950420 RepID=A0ABX0QCY6_9BACT|nr:class I SAM-dependent methyltransferase [Fibrivirga algicola]NID10271.1 class I SAM-dependent methyltransferase [Fibrivirga algicola]
MSVPLDRFSGHAADYARYRIDYPDEVYDYVLTYVPGRQRAWDCATGNGQVAAALARLFEHVEATDLSERQLDNAVQLPTITYRVATAEAPPFADEQFDLVTVAQALHWFNVPVFHEEVQRVLKPNGIIAEWGYGLNQVTPPIDELVRFIYSDVVGFFWDPMRRHIETEYQHLPFDFAEVKQARFTAHRAWPVDWYMNYLRTWSAVQGFQKQHGYDPIDQFEPEFRQLWGTGDRDVCFPIFLRLGMKK